jgi:hypothetical protein
MILASQCFIEYFWVAEQWVFDNGGQLSILHAPSMRTRSWPFNPWKIKTKASSLTNPLVSPTSTFELVKPLDVALTLHQKKFIQSCLCESFSYHRARLAFHFVDPKTSWPSKWGIIIVKEDMLEYLAMALAICNGSSNWLTRYNFNSSLAQPSPHLSPFKYTM